jgi:hypothetical protein
MTIATCDMKAEGQIPQVLFWRLLNQKCMYHGINKVDFRGFMADEAQTNWNAVREVYFGGKPDPRKERTCFFHWKENLKRHTVDHVAVDFRDESRRRCREWQNSSTLEEAEIKYFEIID